MIGVEELKRGSETRERGTAQDAAVAEGSASASERERGAECGRRKTSTTDGGKGECGCMPKRKLYGKCT